jgi:GNAT superfamily N-acetyltransferase
MGGLHRAPHHGGTVATAIQQPLPPGWGQALLAVVPLASLGAAKQAAVVRLCSDALGADCGSLFDYLTASTHVLATLDGRLVGHACWTSRQLQPAGLSPLRTAWVDAVSVAPTHQRRGIGTLVMRRLADETADFDLRALGTEQMAYFARLGWETWDGPTRGVLHDPLDSLMILRTATSPQLQRTVAISAL